MNMNAYKFGLSASGTPPYYGQYGVNDYLPRSDINRRPWEYSSMSYNEQPTVPTTTEMQPEGNSIATMEAIPEECQSHIFSISILPITKHVMTLQIKKNSIGLAFKISIRF